ncbi:hypothetical protein GCM10010324_59090 [Streptomyces hiroshimensis]|uniref:Uncharacterized protein n=1 Tax=Streptomyces hiroshimensis TaxID=66424 RepID=A0ABQ2Z653_9ACTN|nr:hypothetical protein GCM10010324_59090 [Streptomyces hiroshimensis]
MRNLPEFRHAPKLRVGFTNDRLDAVSHGKVRNAPHGALLLGAGQMGSNDLPPYALTTSGRNPLPPSGGMAYATGPAAWGPGWGDGGAEDAGGWVTGGCGVGVVDWGAGWVGAGGRPGAGTAPAPPPGCFGFLPGLPAWASGEAPAGVPEGVADADGDAAPFADGLPLAPRAERASACPGRPPGSRTPPSGSGPASRCLPAPGDGAGRSGSLTLMHPPRARAATATAAIRVTAARGEVGGIGDRLRATATGRIGDAYRPHRQRMGQAPCPTETAPPRTRAARGHLTGSLPA